MQQLGRSARGGALRGLKLHTGIVHGSTEELSSNPARVPMWDIFKKLLKIKKERRKKTVMFNS